MKELKEEFKLHGFDYYQMYKSKNVVAYAVVRNYPTCKVIDFEIFKYRISRVTIFVNEECESYPSDKAFGVWAWSCSDIPCVDKVLKKHFPKLTEKERNDVMVECLKAYAI